jgi:ankyrin repeat protein
MASGTENSDVAWVKAVFADEQALREAFFRRPEIIKELLKNKDFLDTLFNGQAGAFAALLATPAESIAGMDTLIGMFPGDDGGSATPRQMTVAGKLVTWLADSDKAERAFRENPELTQALVGNPAFVERVKVLKPELFRELLNKGKKRFRGDAAMLSAIAKSEHALMTFTPEGGWENEQAEAARKQAEATRKHGKQLVEAARAGDDRAIKSVLNQQNVKAFIDHSNDKGETALMMSAANGHTGAVKLLLDKSADANLQTTLGETALMLAAGGGHTDALKLLLDKGVDINLQDKWGWTALMWAVKGKRPENVKLLLDKSADANLQNDVGQTALMWAAFGGHGEAVKLLLDKGADVNLQTRMGRTALMSAVSVGHIEAVKMLLDKGADANLQDGKGETALMWADACGQKEIASLLRAAMKQKGPRPWTGREHDRRGPYDRERG